MIRETKNYLKQFAFLCTHTTTVREVSLFSTHYINIIIANIAGSWVIFGKVEFVLAAIGY